MHIFSELSLLIALAAGIALIMRALRQPLIIGHIFTGLIVGPSLLGIVESPETITLMGEFGIALLLFIVGLGLNPKVIKEVGKVAVFTGLGQVTFTILLASVMTRALGYSGAEVLFISVALAFSSTIIILKLISDKKDQNKLYGKISIGFLLVQDVIAAFALVAASAAGSGELNSERVGVLAGTGVALSAGVFLLTYLAVRPLSKFLARSQEMLFLFAIAWGFGVATVFYELNFSLEVGALIAGVALANMSYAQEVASRLKPLRDFFLIVFFIALGSSLNLGNFLDYIGPALALSGLVLFGNPIIVMTIMGLLGYTKKTSFKAGLAVAQISEFSLIFLLIGQRGDLVSQDIVATVTVVAIITIAVSTYAITYSDKLYEQFQRYLSLFERRKVKKEREEHKAYDAVLFGYQRGGQDFVRVFKKVAPRFVVVDYDPDAIDILERRQIPYMYGDATDVELLEELNVGKARLVATVMTDHNTNLALLSYLEKNNPGAVFICSADTYEEAAELYGLGASYVMLPHYIGSEKISAFILHSGLKKNEFKKYRDKHLRYIQTHFEPEAESA